MHLRVRTLAGDAVRARRVEAGLLVLESVGLKR